MRGVRVALIVALGLVAIAVGVLLSGSPPSVTRANAPMLDATTLGTLGGGAEICQGGELLPRETSAIRVWLEAVIGPPLTLVARSGSRVLTGGRREAGWSTGSVTIPVSPTPRTSPDVTICVRIGRTRERVGVRGVGSPPRYAAYNAGHEPSAGRVTIEYLRPGNSSWWSLARTVARHMGLGHALSGIWVSSLALAIVAAIVATMALLLVRAVPAAAWVCAAVALLNAACWSLITPPLQGIDEPDHVAYVQELAETGQLPSAGASNELSQEESVVYEDLHQGPMRFNPQFPAMSSDAEQRQLDRDLAARSPPVGAVNAGTAASEPPLYYALETIPYVLGSSGNLLDRVQLMRLLSGLIAAVAVLLTFLFVRETLPGTPWAWTAGALAVALMPALGFVAGAVNPEVLLVAVSAALFYLLARAFRRGLTRHGALAIGGLAAVGFLAKLNFVGLAPGVLMGLSMLALRAPRASRRSAVRAAAAAVLLACAPVALYVCANAVTGGPALGAAAAALQLVKGPIPSEVSYIWQFYLPRLPGMWSYFPGILTTRELWFDGLIGRFGWDDVFFPAWAYSVALAPAAAIACLGVRALVLERELLRPRVLEIATYAVMAAGLLLLVGANSFISQHTGAGGPYWQPRYLLPLLPLFAAGMALAARGAGRWGPPAGVVIVVLVFANDLFGQLQTVARYYG